MEKLIKAWVTFAVIVLSILSTLVGVKYLVLDSYPKRIMIKIEAPVYPYSLNNVDLIMEKISEKVDKEIQLTSLSRFIGEEYSKSIGQITFFVTLFSIFIGSLGLFFGIFFLTKNSDLERINENLNNGIDSLRKAPEEIFNLIQSNDLKDMGQKINSSDFNQRSLYISRLLTNPSISAEHYLFLFDSLISYFNIRALTPDPHVEQNFQSLVSLSVRANPARSISDFINLLTQNSNRIYVDYLLDQICASSLPEAQRYILDRLIIADESERYAIYTSLSRTRSVKPEHIYSLLSTDDMIIPIWLIRYIDIYQPIGLDYETAINSIANRNIKSLHLVIDLLKSAPEQDRGRLLELYTNNNSITLDVIDFRTNAVDHRTELTGPLFTAFIESARAKYGDEEAEGLSRTIQS
ncbi:hypothetical protein [Leptospira licerasiae]|uniref:hypothetical protein n=1 Tax=Leptospira licerasiae TaxID=447106 RepID=UPI003018C96F